LESLLGFGLLLSAGFTGLCEYYDIANKKNIPERLLHAFLAVALLHGIFFLSPDLFFFGLAQAAVIGAMGYSIYRLGQIGLADVYVLCSIAVLVPAQIIEFDYGYAIARQQVPFVVPVFFISGLAFVAVMYVYYLAKVAHGVFGTVSAKDGQGKKDRGLMQDGKKAKLVVCMLTFAASLAAFFLQVSGGGDKSIVIATFGFVIASMCLFFGLFGRQIKDGMIEWVPAQSLDVEEVVAVEKIPAAIAKKFGIAALLDRKNLEAIKKSGLGRVPIYSGMPPYLPFILAGVLAAIFFGGQLITFLVSF